MQLRIKDMAASLSLRIILAQHCVVAMMKQYSCVLGKGATDLCKHFEAVACGNEWVRADDERASTWKHQSEQ